MHLTLFDTRNVLTSILSFQTLINQWELDSDDLV